MKYKHYAPKAQVKLVKGSAAAYVDYVNDHAADGVAALCFDEDIPYLTVPCITYGSRENPLEQAHRLFDALRQLDELGAKTIYAASPTPQGVGLAVYNRLIRAAAFDIVNTIRVIGLTGPTGAGKSCVAQMFCEEGVPVIDADRVARDIVQPNTDCLSAICDAFGSNILRADGTLDRQALASRAFATPEVTERLNSITHPAIMAEIQQRLDDLADAGHPLAVLDAPLLFEAGADALCHRIIAVIASPDTRLSRIMARDGLDRVAAQRRMSAQPNNEFYARDGVTVIQNDATPDALKEAALDIVLQEKRRWC